jgi:F0F1-type ATP synthase epsilon subunit
LSAEAGDMGVLANHEPSIAQLKPGVLEVFEESGGTKSFFRMFNMFIKILLGIANNS